MGLKFGGGAAVLVTLLFGTVSLAQVLPSQTYDFALTQGVHALNEKRYEEAQKAFQEALRAKPGDLKATYHLGATQRSSGQYETARETLRKAAGLDPSFQPVHFDLGVVAYHLSRYEEAQAELVRARSVKEDSDSRRALTHYYLGLTYEKLDRFEEAAPEFLRASALSPELSADAQYHAGLSFYRRNILSEARDAFAMVVDKSPSSSIGISSKEFLEKITEIRPPSKPWNLSADLLVQYDSNVILLPEDSSPPAGISKESDLRWVGVLQGNFDLFRWSGSTGTASYRFYQNFHQDLDEFNVQNHDLGLSLKHRPTQRPYQFQFLYRLSLAQLDGERYLRTQTLGGQMSLARQKAHLTRIEYQYQDKDFYELEAVTGNEDRTGRNHAVGLKHFWFFSSQKGNVNGGYTYDRDSTRGDDWDYQRHRFSLGVRFPSSLLNGWAEPALETQWTLRRYDHANSLSSGTPPEKREDTIQVYSLTLSRSFNRRLSGTLEYLYNLNSSNIEAFDYQRQITSLNLRVSF